MDVTKTLLHSGWEFAFAAYGAVKGPQDVLGLTFRPATVPGTNLTDLQAAGLVEADTSATYEDSFAPYKDMDFVYRTRFEGGAAAAKKHVLLGFEGLDTVAEIFLNGECIAKTEDAHIGYEFDVTGKVQAGQNSLVILFRSPMVEAKARRDRYARPMPPVHLGSSFMFLRKPAYSYFWDWGPEIPVSGIFRPAYLKAYDRAEIQDFHVRYTITGNDVAGTVAVTAPGADGAAATVKIAGGEFTATVVGGKATVSFQVKGARLWWPNGAGEQALYDMEIALAEGGALLDARQHRLGFRTIEVVREPRQDGEGNRFLFKVNGQPVFVRGYNWIPVDNSIPRGYYGLYKGNLDLAKAGNTNMLRIWGGGYYEDNEFYRLCDERGIMVWQDGMFACSLYPDDDPAFLALVRKELAYNIKRLRNYTSLALWCGENENHWGYEEWWRDHQKYDYFGGTKIYDDVYPALVKELDPDRTYWNGSPYSEEPGVRANDMTHGDMHFWDLHSNCGDFSGYTYSAPSFVSETGIQSLPDLRTALTIGGPEDRNIQSFVFDTRNHFENPAKNDRLLKFTGAFFRVSTDFNQSVVLSNLAHAEYMKYALEHWRSQAYDCAGVLIWQINDCWPAISWAVVDYNLQPKACWYYMKRSFGPDMVGYVQEYSINYGPEANSWGHLFVASERDGDKTGVVEMQIVRTTGEVLETQSFPVLLKGRGAASLGRLQLPDYKARRFDCLAVFTLRWDDGTAVRNAYTFSRPKHMKLAAPKVTLTQVGPDTFKVKTDIFAKGVYLFHPDMKVIFDDNYFDLLPGEERTIKATAPARVADIQVMTYHH